MLSGLVLIFIAIFDFMRHRIPNISLLILLIATLVTGSVTVLPLYALIALVVSLLAYRYCGLGAGDVKLLIIITLLMTPQDQIADFWFYVSLIGVSLLTLHFTITRSIKGNIALAPALCGAVLCISWVHLI